MASLEENHLSNDKIKRFLDDEHPENLWDDMVATIPNLPDLLVHLIRAIQALLAAYINMGIYSRSARPVEECLGWLMRGLKVVVFHSDHVRVKEEEVEGNKAERLYFGGDWSKRTDFQSRDEATGISNHDQMSCEHFHQRAKDQMYRPNGPADPFFCFGGEQNIPEVLVLLGRHQEALDFIAHWVTPSIWNKNHVKGAIVAHWNAWIRKEYTSKDMMNIPPPPGHPNFSNYDFFEGESDSKILTRVLAVETLIRAHVINSVPFQKSGDLEMKKKHYRYLYSNIYANIRCTDNGPYYMTADQRYMSRMSLFTAGKCGPDPREETERLVWRLFRDHNVGLSGQELRTVLNMFTKINQEFRNEKDLTDNDLMA